MSDQLFTIVVEVIKAAGAIVPAVLSFFRSRKSDKEENPSDNN